MEVYYNCYIEIVLDLGRRPEARFITGPQYLSQKIISWQDIDYITKRISKFSNENRAGIELTLHRISCIRNRQFLIVGLTCRIGRTVLGSVCLARDLLESEKSILILGKPGVGKTTVIREMARVLSDEMGKRVIIIDLDVWVKDRVLCKVSRIYSLVVPPQSWKLFLKSSSESGNFFIHSLCDMTENNCINSRWGGTAVEKCRRRLA